MTHIVVSPGRNPNNTIVKDTKMDCDDCTGRMVTIVTYRTLVHNSWTIPCINLTAMPSFQKERERNLWVGYSSQERDTTSSYSKHLRKVCWMISNAESRTVYLNIIAVRKASYIWLLGGAGNSEWVENFQNNCVI